MLRKIPNQSFLILSTLLIVLTIVLTVVQTRQNQDLRSAAAGTPIKNCSIGQNAIAVNDEEKKAVAKINAFRKDNNLQALKLQDDLNRAAAWNSNDQAKRNKMGHIDSFNRNIGPRISDCGYTLAEAVENVGQDTADGAAIFEAWKASSVHKNNMLCKNCTEIGIAVHQKYWTMVAAKPLQSSEPTARPTADTSPSPSTSSPEPSPTAPVVPPSANPSPELTVTPLPIARNPDAERPPAEQNLPAGITGLLVKVTVPGIMGVPKTPNRMITVTLSDRTKKVIATVEGTVSYSEAEGIFTGTIALPDSVKEGLYGVKLRMRHSLIREVRTDFIHITEGEMYVLDAETIPQIDFDENNSISLTDFFAFRNCYRQSDCTGYEMDVNDDGIVDLLDYNVILGIFSTSQGD